MKTEIIPLPEKRGLSRIEAAAYIGIGATKFDAMVSFGQMPEPKRIGSRKIWDVRAVNQAFEELPGGNTNETNEWDQ